MRHILTPELKNRPMMHSFEVASLDGETITVSSGGTPLVEVTPEELVALIFQVRNEALEMMKIRKTWREEHRVLEPLPELTKPDPKYTQTSAPLDLASLGL